MEGGERRVRGERGGRRRRGDKSVGGRRLSGREEGGGEGREEGEDTLCLEVCRIQDSKSVMKNLHTHVHIHTRRHAIHNTTHTLNRLLIVNI